jgi:hypothetical protein
MLSDFLLIASSLVHNGYVKSGFIAHFGSVESIYGGHSPGTVQAVQDNKTIWVKDNVPLCKVFGISCIYAMVTGLCRPFK